MVVSDKGGRVIIFKKSEQKGKQPKLDYFFEFPAQEKDFDVQKSIEYSEEVKALSILPSDNYNKLDILTSGYRTIKLDRTYKDKVSTFTNNKNVNNIIIPKVSSVREEIKSKTKRLFRCSQSGECNSLGINKFNTNHFISADEFKIYLWDFNNIDDVYTPIDIEQSVEPLNIEKITKCKLC